MDKREQACADAVRAWAEARYSEEAGILATHQGYGYYTDPDRLDETFELLGESWQDVADRLELIVVEQPPLLETVS